MYYILELWREGEAFKDFVGMCRHILNSTVYIQAPCCSKWFECSECHDEHVKTHTFQFQPQMRFTCKVCNKCFNRDFQLFSEKDKFCDFCNTKFVNPGVTPESKIAEETKLIIDACFAEIIDKDKNPWFKEIDFKVHEFYPNHHDTYDHNEHK